MKLSEVGERGIVRKILSMLNDDMLGDDAGYIEMNDHYLLVSSDIIREKTHLPKGMKPYDIGWFVAAINLSDLSAMGGEPLGLFLSLSLPSNLDEDFALSVVKGAKDCIERFGGRLLGGDTKEHDEITIAGTVIGRVLKEEILLRKGAQPGDLVAVTGCLGRGGAGYLAMKHGIKGFDPCDLLKPHPRVEEGRRLARSGIVTSCMDISDGLASTLYQLSEINGVGFVVDRESLPLCEEAKMMGEILDMDPYSIAINYGGDYELLFTLPEDGVEEMKKEIDMRVIGKVTEENGVSIMYHGRKEILENKGWEHFRQGL